MDCERIGKLIASLRKDKNMTQKQLANLINVSDRTVSKWERGLGCPDVSLLTGLSENLGVNIEQMLNGTIQKNRFVSGNLKKTRFFICSCCGNIALSTGEAVVSCCGRKLKSLTLKKAQQNEKLKVEQIEDELFISSNHPMTKDSYIPFIALEASDKLYLFKQYPEWDMQVRIPREHGRLIWYCPGQGLLYQEIY